MLIVDVNVVSSVCGRSSTSPCESVGLGRPKDERGQDTSGQECVLLHGYQDRAKICRPDGLRGESEGLSTIIPMQCGHTSLCTYALPCYGKCCC
jgi:hypothetical protein